MMNRKMQAAVVHRIGECKIQTVPAPRPGKREVLVKTAVAGLCRTDLKLIEHGHRDLTLPRIPAEELVGTVVAIGKNADPEWLGRLVYVYPGTSCGECEPCRKDAGNLCRNMRIMGFHRDGGFAELVVAPETSLLAVPSELSAEQAVFAEPLSCCLNALELARLRDGESMAIWGAGPAGNLLARAASTLGAKATVVEPDESRRQRLQQAVDSQPGLQAVRIVASLPTTERTRQYDVAIPAVGAAEAYRDALACLAPRGRMVVFSGLPRTAPMPGIDLNGLHYLEQTLVGAYGCSFRHGQQALHMLAAKSILVDDMISHRLPLSRLHEALDLVRQRAGMKIMIYPDAIFAG